MLQCSTIMSSMSLIGVLKIEFQDIEDRIVGLYLMKNPPTRSRRHIKENMQMHLIPLYTMVIESLETSMRVTRSLFSKM